MIGNWRWNLGLGIVGALLTILFSLGKNPLDVMLLRSLYAFIAFAVIAFVLRFALGVILQPPAIAATPEAEDAQGKGTQFDASTPDESEDLNELLKAQLEPGAREAAPAADKANAASKGNGDFRPLNPPQLVSASNADPEQLAKAVRHMTGG
ncbi:hypothetical protein [Paenibacillus sp. NPDC058071]|uniref:hypothetical protein n=1 Tax=Paenibacillus sp. NPDC058071 TaxID=3346326 RepID=UPI0036D81430